MTVSTMDYYYADAEAASPSSSSHDMLSRVRACASCGNATDEESTPAAPDAQIANAAAADLAYYCEMPQCQSACMSGTGCGSDLALFFLRFYMFAQVPQGEFAPSAARLEALLGAWRNLNHADRARRCSPAPQQHVRACALCCAMR
jgi:hypothetical protein